MAAKRQLTERQQRILSVIQGYSYNAYEVCRILNGRGFRDFQRCFYRFESKGRGNRCRLKRNGCKIRSNSVDATLRTLWKRGIIKSISLRWFDGRPTGNNAHEYALIIFDYTTSPKGIWLPGSKMILKECWRMIEMKAELTTKRNETNYSIYVEHFEHLARELARNIITAYKKHCIKQGAPLGYFGEKRIQEYILEKMIVIAKVKVSMKELDKLFPEET